MDERIRVLVAEDEETVLDVLVSLLATEPSVELVATAKDAEHAIELASLERPDVALLDVRMPGGGGPRAAREIARRSPNTRVVAVSAHEDSGSVLRMLRAGALGYVVKDDPTGDILAAIHRSVEGRPSLSGRVVNDVAHTVTEVLDRRNERSPQLRRREDRVRRVLDEGGPRMVFQPVFDVVDGTLVGVEALARFGALPRRSPDVWFAEAEAVGLLPDLELAAVRVALRSLADVPGHAFLSLNVSPITVASEDFLRLMEDGSGGRLVVELTEHAPVADYGELNEALDGLRRLGIRVAVDDAGAGFASLRHIVRTAPDLIKLDVTLVRGVHEDPIRQALISALVSFASQLEVSIIAEGVETVEQLEVIRGLGVRLAQGYLLGAPGPIPEGDWESLDVVLKGSGPAVDTDRERTRGPRSRPTGLEGGRFR